MGQTEEPPLDVTLEDFNDLKELQPDPLVFTEDLKTTYFLDDDEFDFVAKMRASEVLSYFSKMPFLECDKEDSKGYYLCDRKTVQRATERAIARMLTGRHIDLFKFLLANKRYSKFGEYGSTTNFCSPNRQGDYEVSAINYLMLLHTAVAFEKESKFILSDAEKKQLIFDVLPTEGAKFYKNFTCDLKGPFGEKSLIDRESHILMVNTARYMNNSLILRCDKIILDKDQCPDWHDEGKYNNVESGYTKKLADLLLSYLKNHFAEYNSKLYQINTTNALTLLATHAPDEEIRQLASMNLDYLSALMRFQGQDLRRIGASRHQLANKDAESTMAGGPELERFAVLLGKFPGKQINLSYDATLLTAASAHLKFLGKNGYVVHPFLRRMWREERKPTGYGWHYHDNIEIFTLLKNTLLVSGGMYKPYLPPELEWYAGLPVVGGLFKGTIHEQSENKQDAWASPTVVLELGRDSSKLEDYIHFKGHKNRFQRNNSCLYKNVICGMGLHIPERFKFEKDSASSWEYFHDQESSTYMALWRKKCDKEACENLPEQNGSYGVLHIEDDNRMDFSKFKKKRSRKQIKKVSDGIYEYKFTPKETLEIEINLGEGKTMVKKVNGKPYLQRSKKGSVVGGNIITKSSTSLIIKDPKIETGFPNHFIMNFESIDNLDIKTKVKKSKKK